MSARQGNAGAKNLIPVTERSKDEARKISSEGGKASGVSRRTARDRKKLIEKLLRMPVSMDQKDMVKRMRDMGIPEDDWTQGTAVLVRMIQEAQAGNVAAFRALCRVSGDDPEIVLKEKQFEYQKKHDREVMKVQQKTAEAGSSLADLIAAAYSQNHPDDDEALQEASGADSDAGTKISSK